MNLLVGGEMRKRIALLVGSTMIVGLFLGVSPANASETTPVAPLCEVDPLYLDRVIEELDGGVPFYTIGYAGSAANYLVCSGKLWAGQVVGLTCGTAAWIVYEASGEDTFYCTGT